MCPIHEDGGLSSSSHSESTSSDLQRVTTLSKPPLRSPSPKDLNLSSRPLLPSREVSENDLRCLIASQTNLRAKSAESLHSSSPVSLFSNLTGPTTSSVSSFVSARPAFKSPDRQAKKFLACYHATLRSCRPFSTFLSTAGNVPSDSDQEDHGQSHFLSVSPISPPLALRSCLSPYPHAEAAERHWTHPTLLTTPSSPRSMISTTAPDLASSDRGLTRPTWKMCLHPGAVFSGIQQSNQRQYEVHVQIQHVVLEESFLCGYLNIKGLTYEYPSLTTFFEAEIIGTNHSFVTRKWDTNPEIDLRHWEMFPQFRKYHESFQADSSSATADPLNSNYIFMRWKEQFLVPNHQITNIAGASYDGFYYVCLNLLTGEVNGYYYYQCAKEWFEELHLSYEPLKSFATYSFQ